MAKPTGAMKVIEETIQITGGKMPIDLLAHNEAEAQAYRDALKGKHGGKTINVRVAPAEEFLPNILWRD